MWLEIQDDSPAMRFNVELIGSTFYAVVDEMKLIVMRVPYVPFDSDPSLCCCCCCYCS